MRSLRLVALVIGLALVILACGGGDSSDAVADIDLSSYDAPPRLLRPGGMTTAFDDSDRAFSLTARNVNHYEMQVFAAGRKIFEATWAPPGAAEFGGLGPDFDATACSSCHRDDGRSAGPAGDGVLPVGMVVKLTTDDPAILEAYGGGLASMAVEDGAEAVVSVSYETVSGVFDDGTVYDLRRPVYSVETGDGPALPSDAVLGVRLAPQLPGLGLLELISVNDLEARSDPDDIDGDGISGRLGLAHDPFLDIDVVGRFGWNGDQPTVEQQSATAFFNDMGITSRYFPSPDCGKGGECLAVGGPVTSYYEPAGFGGDVVGSVAPTNHELGDGQLYQLTIYTQILAVPAGRDLDDPEVQRGWELLNYSGCASCHGGTFTTERGPVQGISSQEIQPFTDLLVHDLGLGLSDQTIAGAAVATEWRTPPLWGIGLVDTVNGHTSLLHDGRARTYEEAILWHDGEAAASAAAYRALSAADRAAVIRFLESL